MQSSRNNTVYIKEEIARFNSDPQNIHDPLVGASTTSSILALNQLYGHTIDEEIVMTEIDDLIYSFNYQQYQKILHANLSAEDQKKNIIKFFEQMKLLQYHIHSDTQLSFQRIYCVIFKAIQDNNLAVLHEDHKKNLSADEKVIPDHLMLTKKLAFLDAFINAHLEYEKRGISREMCVGGIVRNMVNSLNKSHAYVMIGATTFDVKSSLHEQTQSIIANELLKYPLNEQRNLLLKWDQDYDNNDIVTVFRQNIITPIKTNLHETYANFLKGNEIEDIINQLEYLPNPIRRFFSSNLTYALEKCALFKGDSEIDAKTFKTFDVAARYQAYDALQEQLKIAFKKKTRLTEEEISFFAEKLMDLLKLDVTLNTLFEKLPNSKSAKQTLSNAYKKTMEISSKSSDEHKHPKQDYKSPKPR